MTLALTAQAPFELGEYAQVMALTRTSLPVFREHCLTLARGLGIPQGMIWPPYFLAQHALDRPRLLVSRPANSKCCGCWSWRRPIARMPRRSSSAPGRSIAHVSNILGKLGVSSRAGAIRIALQADLG
jgi:hypothetical protein